MRQLFNISQIRLNFSSIVQFSKQQTNSEQRNQPTFFKPLKRGDQMKETPQLKQFKRELSLTFSKENLQRAAILENTKPTDVYKQIDASFERFFLKRPYDLKGFNFWIAVLSQQKKIEQLSKVLTIMEELNVVPNQNTYINLIQAYGRAYDIQKSEQYFNVALSKFGPSIYLYNSLLFAYARNKLPILADKLFRELQENEILPDTIAYTTLINCHYKSGNLSRCWDLFMDVRLGKTSTPPDANLFGLMIEICSHTHDAEKAIGLYEMMHDMEFTDTTELYNAYIKALGSRRDYGMKSIEIFQKMIRSGVNIDSDTIVHTLKGCSSIGDVKTAFDVLQLMKDNKIPNNEYIQNMIIKVYAGACKQPFTADTTKDIYINDAWKVFQESRKLGWVSSQTLDSMCLLMTSAGRLPDLEGLVFPLYQQFGIEKTQKTYESLIKLLFEDQRFLDVYRIIELMDQQKIQLTFNIICMYLETAIRLVDEDKMIVALKLFKSIGRDPKPHYLQFLGEQDPLPLKLHAVLDEFETKFGLVKDRTLRSEKKSKHLHM